MSAEQVDHAKEALNWVTAASDHVITMEQTSAFASIAQVYATLALVEQQRVANIIALIAVPAEHVESMDGYPGLRDEIREALGLS